MKEKNQFVLSVVVGSFSVVVAVPRHTKPPVECRRFQNAIQLILLQKFPSPGFVGADTLQISTLFQRLYRTIDCPFGFPRHNHHLLNCRIWMFFDKVQDQFYSAIYSAILVHPLTSVIRVSNGNPKIVVIGIEGHMILPIMKQCICPVGNFLSTIQPSSFHRKPLQIYL